MSATSETIRVLIADNHPVMCVGIRTVLEGAPDIEVVGEAQDDVEAKHLLARLHPDILLLGLVLSDQRPFEVGKWVRTNYPQTIVLIQTAHDRDCFLAEAIEVGAAGFLTKEETAQQLIEAIRRATQGEALITGVQLARIRVWYKEVGERWESLTERERQVLALAGRGQGTNQIAETLTIEVSTVETHLGNILGKLGTVSRAEAIAWAWQHGIVENSIPLVPMSRPMIGKLSRR